MHSILPKDNLQMYSTTIMLDMEDMRRLKCENAHGIHSLVYSLFPDYKIGAGRRPFSFAYDARIIRGSPALTIFVNSDRHPVIGEFCSETICVPSGSMSDVTLDFKIITCAEKCVGGKRIPVVFNGDAEYVTWLVRKLEAMGIRVLDCVYRGTCMREVSHGNGVSVVHPAVFSGQLSGPSDAVNNLFIHGIGHNGAFGAAFAKLSK